MTFNGTRAVGAGNTARPTRGPFNADRAIMGTRRSTTRIDVTVTRQTKQTLRAIARRGRISVSALVAHIIDYSDSIALAKSRLKIGRKPSRKKSA